MKLLPYLSVLFFLCCQTTVWAGNATIAKDLNTAERMEAFFHDLNDFNSRFPQEKVFLHFDNTAYFLKETIWFSAYVVQASDFLPTDLSRVLYVELLSPEGAVIETKKLYVNDGRCHGDFYLDSLYLSGFYEVRAYTRYMLNFGDEAVFSRVFPVYNSVEDGSYGNKAILDREMQRRKIYRDYRDVGQNSFTYYLFKPNKSKKYYYEPLPQWDPKLRRSEVKRSEIYDTDRERIAEDPELSMDFFPEGGVLIEGQRQRIAFSLKRKDGREVSAEGIVTNSRGDSLTTFHTEHLGRGVFELPSTANGQRAELHYAGKKYRFELPECFPSGCTLRTERMGDSLLVEFKYVGDGELFTDSLLAVAFSCGGRIYDFQVFHTDGPKQLLMDVKQMPEGVNTICIFDEVGRAIAQRMCFVRHFEQPRPEIVVTSETTIPDPYAPIRLHINSSSTHNGTPMERISLAVRDYDSDDLTHYEDDLYCYLLLSSEIKGFIPRVYQYFESDDGLHRRWLDLLMLTQGWQRYQWENMNERTKEEVWGQPVERGIMIDGCVYNNEKARKPRLKNIPLSFEMMDIQTTVRTNDMGRFAVQLPPFYGYLDYKLEFYHLDGNNPKYYFNYMDDFISYCLITINRWFSPKPKPISFYELNLPDEIAEGGVKVVLSDSTYEVVHPLPEAGITRRNKRRHIQHRYSLRHYNLAEEVEYMLDVHKYDMHDIMFHPDELVNKIVLSIMDRYNYPPCSFNSAIIEHYGTDVDAPEGELYWALEDIHERVVKTKEIVIRSDTLITKQFWYPTSIGKNTKHENYQLFYSSYIDGDGMVRYTNEVMAKYPTGFRIAHVGRNEVPDAVACFLPYAPGEMVVQWPQSAVFRRGTVQGYSRSRLFKSPDYSADFAKGYPLENSDKSKGSALPELPPDYRRTLYWNPDLELDENGQAEISFYNNSSCRHLVVSAQGLSPEGQPAAFEKEL